MLKVVLSVNLQDTCFGVLRRELEHSANDILPVFFFLIFFFLFSNFKLMLLFSKV